MSRCGPEVKFNPLVQSKPKEAEPPLSTIAGGLKQAPCLLEGA